VALVLGTPIYVVMKLGESVGWSSLIGWSIALLVVYTLFNAWRRIACEQERRAALEARRGYLMDKYCNGRLVELILNSKLWEQQTAEQLRDSLGDPDDVDEKVMKSKRRETWKYFPAGANRFALRVVVENGLVTGWDDKR
jgi:hypothetical protein